MCGRYALSLRVSHVRQRLADQDMPADEAPADEDMRPTYNFAPGYHGLIYRADTPDRGAGEHPHSNDHDNAAEGEPSPKRAKLSRVATTEQSQHHEVDGLATKETKYKLQTAQWGLIPFWTKRQPDYASKLKTINCRDDSLIENRGMWNTMKQRKRCIVVAEGFYEWLKKNGGKDKMPHYTKRKDGQMMCFAGLWDCVQYEGSDEKLYTYTVITTDSNPQLKFLHDRMPVILEPGSEAMKAWLDPNRAGWDKELQSMLKPYEGELECYAVDKGVGKVGNNKPEFVVPIDSKENKKNIANFFGKQKETAKEVAAKNEAAAKEIAAKDAYAKVKGEENGDDRTMSKVEESETNAPLPKPKDEPDDELEQAIKQDTNALDDGAVNGATNEAVEKGIKREISEVDDATLLQAAGSPRAKKRKLSPPPTKKPSASPTKGSQTKKTRSATTNHTVVKSPTKEGNARITSFFGK